MIVNQHKYGYCIHLGFLSTGLRYSTLFPVGAFVDPCLASTDLADMASERDTAKAKISSVKKNIEAVEAKIEVVEAKQDIWSDVPTTEWLFHHDTL